MVLAEDHHVFLEQMMSRGDYPNYSRSAQANEFRDADAGDDGEFSAGDEYEQPVEYYDEEVGSHL